MDPNNSQFFWVKPNGSSKSWIYVWLINEEYTEFVSDAVISAAPLIDHCLILLTLTPVIKQSVRKDYWTFNAEHLKDKDFCSQIRNLIGEVEHNSSLSTNRI